MSGPQRSRLASLSEPEPEPRPVLGPAGNKARSVELRKPIVKKTQKSPPELRSPEEQLEEVKKEKIVRRSGGNAAAAAILRQPNLSMSASCSSDASTDSSSHSRASAGGRIGRRSGAGTPSPRKKQCGSKGPGSAGKSVGDESEGVVVVTEGAAAVKKRCAWVTSSTDLLYAAFHDEEWGLPVHDDKKLFELLSLSTALAELNWPVILSKRPIFRDVFLDFDPITVSKLNDKKIATPGSPASTLLSEVKLRAIIENARQVCKIIVEFGSFDKYIWGFANNKPIVCNFRYSRQVPIKTSKAETISKDLVRRGFRGVGPTVVYSFMQVAGITNDHLISCFRYQDCIIAGDLKVKNEGIMSKNEGNSPENLMELKLARDIDDLSLAG